MTDLQTPARGRITPGAEAERLARAAYDALLADLDEVGEQDWARPTDCTGWTVRDMVGHLLGAARGHASLPEFVRQAVWGARHKGEHSGSALDAMNAWQIRSVADLDAPRVVSDLRATAPRAVAGRMRRARTLGWVPVGIDPAGSWQEGVPTRTTMADLCSTVLTRDVWAHRLDLARAVDRPLRVDPELDGRLVADLVADWGARHGRPFHLVLTGAAGGEFRQGPGAAALELDALDFVRLMAGRRPETVPPASDPVAGESAVLTSWTRAAAAAVLRRGSASRPPASGARRAGRR
jgi:uncharacterized protein (TIGR03083 family)